MTPEQLAASGTENGSQAALFCWAAQSNIPELKWMFAIPNGGARDKRTGAKLKATGVKAGVPDIFLPVTRKEYAGLWIEMKTKTGKVSKEQSEYMHFLHGQGYVTRVCWGWHEAVNEIIKYLRLK